MRQFNILQIVGIWLVLLVVLGFVFFPVALKASDRHHHHHETTVNNYSIKAADTTGLAALFAADQIHPSKNISGLQLGFGAAQYKSELGLAAGAALNVTGWGMLNTSIAKEEKSDPFIGIGINLSIGP